MKTAEQWIEEWVEEWAKDTDVTLREIIEQAQKEAYNQALEDVTEKAKVSLFDWINDGFKEFKQNSNHYSINDGTYVKIDEQSILKLKK